jgi:hypothetical protein
MKMDKPLEPPPRVFAPFKPRDQWIARVIDTRPLDVGENPFDGLNGSEKLQLLLDSAGSEVQRNALLSRLLY